MKQKTILRLLLLLLAAIQVFVLHRRNPDLGMDFRSSGILIENVESIEFQQFQIIRDKITGLWVLSINGIEKGPVLPGIEILIRRLLAVDQWKLVFFDYTEFADYESPIMIHTGNLSSPFSLFASGYAPVTKMSLVRNFEGPKVYGIEDPENLLFRSSEQWLDRRLLPGAIAPGRLDIIGISVRQFKGNSEYNYSLRLHDNKWILEPQDTVLLSTEVEGMIRKLLGWEAAAIAGRLVTLQNLLEEPQIIIELQTAGNQEIQYTIGRLGSAFYIVDSESPWVYITTRTEAEEKILSVSHMTILD